MTLWKFNPITGFWRAERACEPETAQQWLELFQKDAPQDHFVLSRLTPRFDPIKTKRAAA
jgi:hypothetical protein